MESVEVLTARLEKYLGQKPQVDDSAYVAKSAVLMGAVKIANNASIFPNCTLRADLNTIEIGEYSNIQDNSCIHLADNFGVKVGSYTTVGHNVILHACTIGDRCLIGMGAIVIDGAVIGDECIIGAGALVTKNTVIPDGSMVLGSPAKVVKALSPEQRAGLKDWAFKYSVIAATNKKFDV
ncbi:MAG: gamma carbonic anhydrase family protein [Opitutales bacterium]